jgi:hypothetical protein
MTPPTNLQHAVWAEDALYSFAEQAKCDYGHTLGSLLCALMHWAKFSNVDFETELDGARFRFEMEVDQ